CTRGAGRRRPGTRRRGARIGTRRRAHDAAGRPLHAAGRAPRLRRNSRGGARMNSPRDRVGKRELRVDGPGLVAGTAQFADDFEMRGTLHAKFLFSPHAHARIRRIDAVRARALPGVACVLTYADVPRIAYTTAGQNHPEPSPYDVFMFDRKV